MSAVPVRPRRAPRRIGQAVDSHRLDLRRTTIARRRVGRRCRRSRASRPRRVLGRLGVITTVTGRRSACSSATILAGQRGQGRHVEEAEPDPVRGEIVGPVAPEQAATGDGAHLVIQLRPAHASAAVAEPDEFDRVRVGDSRGGAAWIHRWRALPSLGRARDPDGDAARSDRAWRNRRRRRRSGPTAGRWLQLCRPTALPGASATGGRHRRPVDATPGRGLVHDFVHQLIHTNGRSPNTRAERARPAQPRSRATSPRPGAVGQPPALVRRRARGPRTGRRRGAGCRRGRPSRRATRRPPTRRSRPTSPPCSRGTSGSRARGPRSSIRCAGPMPPHLASLTLTPATTPTSAVEVLVGRRTLSSATIGSDERSWSQRRSSRRGPGTAAR